MKKYIIFLLGAFLLPSCEYRQEDVFDKTPAERTADKLNENKKVLEYDGYWLLSCYPEVYRQGLETTDYVHRGIGGYNILLKLNDGKVVASSEFMTTNEEQQSFYSYQLAENLSISFDTYNEVLHHFRTTSAQHPNARGGDIFYDIIKKEGDTYTLQGRTSRNLMTLSRFSGNREAYNPAHIERDGLVMDRSQHTVSVYGHNANLTPLEFDLLFLLASNENEVISRTTLLKEVWGYADAGDTRLVSVHIQRLRAKVEKDPEHPDFIHTVRGIGYKFCTSSENIT